MRLSVDFDAPRLQLLGAALGSSLQRYPFSPVASPCQGRGLLSGMPLSDSCSAAKAPIASIAMRGMKHVLQIARNKLDEAAADRRTARACTATKCGKAAPPSQKSDRGGFETRVTLPGHSSVCLAPGIGTQAAAARPTGLPIRILQLSP